MDEKEQITVNQHYVPQSYLKRFTTDGSQIFVYDKVLGKEFPQSIRNIAYGKKFYDIPDNIAEAAGIHPQIIEHTFAEIESEGMRLLDWVIGRIISGKSHIFKPNIKEFFAYFLALQYLRTSEQRTVHAEFIKKFEENVLIRGLGKNPEKVNVQPDKEKIELTHNSRLFHPNVVTYVQTFLSHIWIIGLNYSNTPFYTSDDPVVVRPYKEDPNWSYSGLGSEGIEISYPINPQYILILREKTFHKTLAHANNKTTVLKHSEVDYYNQLQVAQSNRQIYSSVNNFEFAKKVLEDNPIFRDPNRLRIHVVQRKL